MHEEGSLKISYSLEIAVYCQNKLVMVRPEFIMPQLELATHPIHIVHVHHNLPLMYS